MLLMLLISSSCEKEVATPREEIEAELKAQISKYKIFEIDCRYVGASDLWMKNSYLGGDTNYEFKNGFVLYKGTWYNLDYLYSYRVDNYSDMSNFYYLVLVFTHD